MNGKGLANSLKSLSSGIFQEEGPMRREATEPQLQIEHVVKVIKSKEAKGQKATFERNLLKEWVRYEGYEGAKQALADCGKAPES